jgi:serine/threonine protein phosphatase 1
MAKRIFAIGDIHGCFDQFRTLLEEKIKATPDDRIILIGDYIDRGKKSREVVDYIIGLVWKGYDIIPLMGNHESMLLDALDLDDPDLWLWNGGGETLRSFGIELLNELEPRYVKFFENLVWYYSYDNYLFVHAGFNDTLENPFADKLSMVWIRKESYNNPVLKDRVVIHGHTPIPLDMLKENIMKTSKVIDIDTGCVYPGNEFGKLTAIEIPSKTLYTV